MDENPSPQGHLRGCRWCPPVFAVGFGRWLAQGAPVAGARRTGIVVVWAMLAASCVNLSYPPGASRDGGVSPFVAHLPNGAACHAPADCQSGFCVDGVCCMNMCEGTCLTCARAGSKGFCMPVDVGTDPRNACQDDGANSCGQDGFCDGAGACRRYPAGTACGSATCAGFTLTAVPRCDEQGVCTPVPGQTCSPYLCGPAPELQCLTTCNVDGDCVSPHRCENGTCGALPVGSVCKNFSDCDSNFCEQGVCCATACAGVCKSCALKGSAGTCTPVPAGGMPVPGGVALDTCMASDPSTCGMDGTCDGAGGCRLHLLGKACSAATCSTATLRNGGACDGKGKCQIPAAVTCGGYTCASTIACRTSCLADPDCASPSVCGRNSCGGLVAQYFKQTNLTDLALSRTDPNIEFDWAGGSPSPLLNVDNFSVRWRGKITARFSQTYTFFAATDDGERLFVDNVKLIDAFIRHASVPEIVSPPINLTAGKPVDITFEYFETGGDASARLFWQSQSEPKAIVPTSALSPP
jgi:PA14 domain